MPCSTVREVLLILVYLSLTSFASAKICFLQFPHARVTLQGKYLSDRGDVAFDPGGAAFGEDAAKSALHRRDGCTNGIVAADNQPNLTKDRDIRERELRIAGGYQDQRNTP